jgi:hypothetical protein
MSNPVTILTDTISQIQSKINSLEISINDPQFEDNKVKEQICEINKYNDKLIPVNNMLYYASTAQPVLLPMYTATKSLSGIMKQFKIACTNYDTKREEALDQLKPYISQLRESLNTVQRLIDSNKDIINSAYEKTTSLSQYIPKLTQQEVQVGASNYKRSKRRISRRRISKKRISKRKTIKKKSKKNRRR